MEQHLIKGWSFRDFSHLCQELARFEEEVLDLLVHRTTQERPLDRFQEERPLLTPLPAARFVGSREAVRKVSWDCLISFGAAATQFLQPTPARPCGCGPPKDTGSTSSTSEGHASQTIR